MALSTPHALLLQTLQEWSRDAMRRLTGHWAKGSVNVRVFADATTDSFEFVMVYDGMKIGTKVPRIDVLDPQGANEYVERILHRMIERLQSSNPQYIEPNGDGTVSATGRSIATKVQQSGGGLSGEPRFDFVNVGKQPKPLAEMNNSEFSAAFKKVLR